MQKEKKKRKQRFDEIVEKEKKIKLKLLRYRFNYLSSSDMCKSFNKTKNLEENKTQVNTIENNLANLIKNV